MYFIYNDKICYGTPKEEKDWMFKFHRPKSTSLWDDIRVFKLYVAESPEVLKSNIVNRARWLQIRV